MSGEHRGDGDTPMTFVVEACADAATNALGWLTGRPGVRIRLDGRSLLGALDIDRAEHERRFRLGLGAVTSLGLLHSLWLLPRGVPVAEDQIPPRRLSALLDAPHFALRTSQGFSRSYEPAATVRAVAFAGTRPDRLVQRAIMFTPIFERWVLVDDSPRAVSTAAVELATKWGVGVASIGGGSVHPILAPAPAVIGQPAVYRWWIGEIAYSSWRQSSTQLVS